MSQPITRTIVRETLDGNNKLVRETITETVRPDYSAKPMAPKKLTVGAKPVAKAAPKKEAKPSAPEKGHIVSVSDTWEEREGGRFSAKARLKLTAYSERTKAWLCVGLKGTAWEGREGWFNVDELKFIAENYAAYLDME